MYLKDQEVFSFLEPRLWNLGFERMQEKYSYVLDTAARIEKLKQEAFEKMKEQRIADKMEIEEKEKVCCRFSAVEYNV